MNLSKLGKWVALSFFLLATVSVILYAAPEKKNIKVTGAITNITGDSIEVDNTTTFLTNNKTKYIKTTRENLEVGYIVDVKGYKQGDDYIARTVKLKDDLSDDGGKKRTRIDTGILTDIDLAEGTLLLLTLDDEDQYLVDESLKLKGRNGLNCTAANLIVGLQLRVKYKKPKNGGGEDTIYQLSSVQIIGADKLKGHIEEDTAPAGPLPSITVNGNWIYYDDCTVVIGAREGIDDPSELAVGTRVFVLVNPLEDGTYLGNKVIVNNSDDNAGDKTTESGMVTSFTDGSTPSFVLNSDKTFFVDENTEFKVKGYDGEFLWSDFDEGLTVKVTAYLDSEGNLIATKVVIFLPTFNYCGEVQAIGVSPESIKVMDIVFEIRDGTQFGDGTALSDYTTGDFAEIKGIEWPGTPPTPVAAEIEPCDDDDFMVKGEILISSVDSSTGMLMLDVGGIEVIVTPLTDIKFGSESDLTMGTYVQVIGDEYAGEQLLAKRIRIF